MSTPHETVVRVADNGMYYGLCLSCLDRGPLEIEKDEAGDWSTAHAARSKLGNMLQPHVNSQRRTAARTYRERSVDPRWTEDERLLWAQMADELERPQDEGQDTLF